MLVSLWTRTLLTSFTDTKEVSEKLERATRIWTLGGPTGKFHQPMPTSYYMPTAPALALGLVVDGSQMLHP